MVVKTLTAVTILALLHTVPSEARTPSKGKGATGGHRHGVSRVSRKPLDLAVIKTANGLTAKVAASAREKFQGFIDKVESLGNRISAIGCYVPRGHMPGSKHYRGLACDFAQVKRNVTKDKFMYSVADVAKDFGLTDGCTWGWTGGRYDGPDCGHIEVPGPTATYSAKRRRK